MRVLRILRTQPHSRSSYHSLTALSQIVNLEDAGGGDIRYTGSLCPGMSGVTPGGTHFPCQSKSVPGIFLAVSEVTHVSGMIPAKKECIKLLGLILAGGADIAGGSRDTVSWQTSCRGPTTQLNRLTGGRAQLGGASTLENRHPRREPTPKQSTIPSPGMDSTKLINPISSNI